MIPIILTQAEMWTACLVGLTRRLVSMRKGLDKYKHTPFSNFQTDIEGAIAEQCFAKYTRQYWSCSVNSFKEPDVGEWQVRSTTYPSGHLIVRPNDHDHYRVALLTTEGHGAQLHGWIETVDAKQDCYWRPEHDSWWVPQSALHAFECEPEYAD